MTRHAMWLSIGIVLMFASIFLIKYGTYFWLFVFGPGVYLSFTHFSGLCAEYFKWLAVKNEENKLKKERRKLGTKELEVNPAQDALMRAIEEKRKTDPLIGAKLGGKEISQRLIAGMKNDKGVHVESLLSALGALAGYSCQSSLRELAVAKGDDETSVFMIVKGADGKKYFYGDPLNQRLAENQYSVWGLAAGAAQSNGCTTLPDVNEIFTHVTHTVGGSEFGIPRIPDGHKPGDIPTNYVKALWPSFLPIIKKFCKQSAEWPILYGSAIQEIIDMSKGVIAPDLALKIVMESAIPMSKVDLATA